MDGSNLYRHDGRSGLGCLVNTCVNKLFIPTHSACTERNLTATCVSLAAYICMYIRMSMQYTD